MNSISQVEQIPSTDGDKLSVATAHVPWAQLRPNKSGYDPYGDPASKYVPLPALPTVADPEADAKTPAPDTTDAKRWSKFRASVVKKVKRD